MIERSKKGPRRPAARPRRMPATPVPRIVHTRSGPLHVELVVVGRELLRGRAQDRNGTWLAGALSRRGAIVHRITTVDDSERAIANAVSEALERRAHLIVTTGGLGPSPDDRTIAGVSEAVRLPLSLSPRAKQMVEAAYARVRNELRLPATGMTAAREKMCTIPVGSEPIENTEGVVPGVLVRLVGGAAIVSLPGLPSETQATFEAVLPRLKNLMPPGVSARREVGTPTRDESSLRSILDHVIAEHPAVWVSVRSSGFRKGKGPVVVTLEAFAPTGKEAEGLVDAALRRLLALAGGGR